VDHLNRLAGQFSQFARLPEPHLEAVDLGELARAVVEDDGGTATELRITGPAPVRGDWLLLSRAIHNLLLNAREAGRPGVPVEIEIAAHEGRVVLEVLDRGSGLPVELQRRLFEPYVSTKRRGSGLGLSLVRDIIQQHGGTITLANREGGGARATLVLPKAGMPAADRTAGDT
jgi:signal transduction histidine kinase